MVVGLDEDEVEEADELETDLTEIIRVLGQSDRSIANKGQVPLVSKKCPVCVSKKSKKKNVVAEKCLVCGNERDDVSGGVPRQSG